VSLVDWLSNTRRRVDEDGVEALGDSAALLYNGAWRVCGSRLPLGTNVYDREWDLLVLLDGCRVDSLRSFEDDPERSFVEDVDTLRSVASTSREWLPKTFSPDRRGEVERTAYVTANPYTEEILSSGSKNRSPFNPANWESLNLDDFLLVDEVWRDGWDEELGTVPPRVVTDRAITAAREHGPDRLIVHYMQPHQPFVGERACSNDQAWIEESCWGALRRGDATVEEVREAYRENLAIVLDDVALLLENVDASKVVISADHGNAFGEWGVYGHPNGFLHPSVKTVPWLVTTASDRRTYTPSTAGSDPADVDQTTEDRLHDLGYL